MNRTKSSFHILPLLIGGLFCAMPAKAQDATRLLGRWNLSVKTSQGAHPSWLEIRKSGNQALVGSFVGQFGSVRPVSKIEFDGRLFRFAIPPQWEKRQDDMIFLGQIDGLRLAGTSSDEQGGRVTWTATRAPSLTRSAAPQFLESSARQLFNGKNLQGWRPRSVEIPNGWEVKNGYLSNTHPGNDLITTDNFTDFKLHAEFRYPSGSNSGIYLRGRYEMQIEDNYGDPPNSLKIGGVYGFLTPSTNASKPAGEWQEVDITLIGRQITVIVNGERVIDRQSIPGPTGGALDNDEAAPGPLMIQGDHGPIEFRKLTLIPAE